MNAEEQRRYQQGLAEKHLERVKESHNGLDPTNIFLAQQMALYSGLHYNACFKFITKGTW